MLILFSYARYSSCGSGKKEKVRGKRKKGDTKA